MFHVVLLDIKDNEFWKICDGYKTMLAYGSNADRPKYRRAKIGNEIYFLEDSGKGVVKAKAKITDVIKINVEEDENAEAVITQYVDKLQISKTDIKHLLQRQKVYLIEFDEFDLISPRVYVDFQKLRDFATYKEMDDDIFKPVH